MAHFKNNLNVKEPPRLNEWTIYFKLQKVKFLNTFQKSLQHSDKIN